MNTITTTQLSWADLAHFGSTIPKYAFKDRKDITSVVIPDSVTEIEDFAFQRCVNLEEVIVAAGSNLVTISSAAFLSCKRLEALHLPASIKSIGSNAFSHCFRLSNLTFADGISFNELSTNAFVGCDSIPVSHQVWSVTRNMQ